MSDKISAKEYSLSKIFSADFEYHIPKYQRPYSWTEDEAAILFDDLYDFYELDNDDNYFLGSIVLIKSDNKPYSEVIDGQQRLTTLSIFLAVMRTLSLQNNIKSYVKPTYKKRVISWK